MAELNTLSKIMGPNGANITQTAVTTNILISVAGNPIGAVQSFSVNEQRRIAHISEVGTDGQVDSVPESSVTISGSCSRTRFNNMRVAQAFSRPYVHVAAQRIPFDIDVIDGFAGSDPSTQIITKIKNVWISGIKYTYRADNFVIVEDMDWEAEAIYSILGANNNVVPGASGGRNLPLQTPLNIFEREADRGGRRGALDAFGLLQEVSLL